VTPDRVEVDCLRAFLDGKGDDRSNAHAYIIEAAD